MSREARRGPSPKQIDAIVESLEAGSFACQAFAAAGISNATYYNWLKRGDKGEEPYAELLQRVRTAEASAEDRAVKIIANASLDTWQAAAWYLERKHWDRWGRKDHLLAAMADKPTEKPIAPKFIVEISTTDKPACQVSAHVEVPAEPEET